MDQNFSNQGARLTSIESIGSLEMRDRILSTFTVHDSKISVEARTKSLMECYTKSPPKDNKYIVVRRNSSQRSGDGLTWKINTKLIKTDVRDTLPLKYSPFDSKLLSLRNNLGSEALNQENGPGM